MGGQQSGQMGASDPRASDRKISQSKQDSGGWRKRRGGGGEALSFLPVVSWDWSCWPPSHLWPLSLQAPDLVLSSLSAQARSSVQLGHL